MTRDLLNPPPWMEFGWGKFMMMIINNFKALLSAFQTPSLWRSWILISVNNFLSFLSTKNLGNFWRKHVFLVKVKEIISLLLRQNFAKFSISQNWDYSPKKKKKTPALDVLEIVISRSQIFSIFLNSYTHSEVHKWNVKVVI